MFFGNKKFVAQSLTEYALVVAIVTLALVFMSPLLRRVINGMVRIVADRVGNQLGAEQAANVESGGFVEGQHVTITAKMDTERKEMVRAWNYIYNDQVASTLNTVTNTGLTPNP